jgi:hypothetical protein
MSVFNTVRVIVYRFHEKGLEVFLEHSGLDEEGWRIPFAKIAKYKELNPDSNLEIIELDPVEGDDESLKTYAIEGDWHDIPSIRKLIKEDVKLVANKVVSVVPDIEKGTYVALKETFKKVLPQEYEVLHELKDILLHRNLLKNI